MQSSNLAIVVFASIIAFILLIVLWCCTMIAEFLTQLLGFDVNYLTVIAFVVIGCVMLGSITVTTKHA